MQLMYWSCLFHLVNTLLEPDHLGKLQLSYYLVGVKGSSFEYIKGIFSDSLGYELIRVELQIDALKQFFRAPSIHNQRITFN